MNKRDYGGGAIASFMIGGVMPIFILIGLVLGAIWLKETVMAKRTNHSL